MAWTYSCPICESVVNPDETVTLLGSRQDVTILLGFHPQPGNYTIYLPPGCDMRRGDDWEFYCPVCRQNLRANEHQNLCALKVWQGSARRKILFSRVVGERATYLVRDKSLEESYGKHKGNYENTIPRYKIPEELK
ncbi:MAG: hypothetical protein GY854_17720 [Deltaproteobacteria bacterium]|nr:hypothetical protein [Deltaproteobacteria bacterium]